MSFKGKIIEIEIAFVYLTFYYNIIDSKAQSSKFFARLTRNAEGGDPVYSSYLHKSTEELDSGPTCGKLCRERKICVKQCPMFYEY